MRMLGCLNLQTLKVWGVWFFYFFGTNLLLNWSWSGNLQTRFVFVVLCSVRYRSPQLKAPSVAAREYSDSLYCNCVWSRCHSLLHFMLKTNRIKFHCSINHLLSFSGFSHSYNYRLNRQRTVKSFISVATWPADFRLSIYASCIFFSFSDKLLCSPACC